MYSLLKRLLSVDEKNALFSERDFFQANKFKTSQLETIGLNFLRGYHIVLNDKGFDKIFKYSSGVEKHFRGFIYEGGAMAITLLNFFGIATKNKIQNLLTGCQENKHIYMLHVGAGWAFARLPVNIEKKIEKFDPLLRWLIIDGYGFHQAYFKTKKYVELMQFPKELKNPYSVKVFYQGVGRCLWFIECATPDRIANRVFKFPAEYHEDLWAGVGLACTYACGVNEEEILKLKELSGSYVQHFTQGSAFAAKARDRAEITTPQNELACQLICNLTIKEASSITDYCQSQIPPEFISEKQYSAWKKLIRNSIYKHNESVSEKIIN